jgi:hypothetical protein
MSEPPKIWFDEYDEITRIARDLPTTLAEYQRLFIGSWTCAPENTARPQETARPEPPSERLIQPRRTRIRWDW